MAYKVIDEVKKMAEMANDGAKGILGAMEMLDSYEKTLPINLRHEVQKLKNKHSDVFKEAEEAVKNANFDTSTW